jgi:GT2 family glycosyltransferase
MALTPKFDIVSYGYASLPFRPDGYCLLMKKQIYTRLNGIDTQFKMNWGITDLVARAINAGVSVGAVINPVKYITHLGGQSYTVKTNTQRDVNKPTIHVLLRMAAWRKVQAIRLT